ncbi:MAG: hypothetical protein ACRD29_13870 [Acidimicrobiales bacterium]
MTFGCPWDTCRATTEATVRGGVDQAVKDIDTFVTVEMPALFDWEFGRLDADAITQPACERAQRSAG